MKKISLRTKLEAVFIMIICIILVSAGALSVTRTISDTHDDVETFIRNSNGNYWEATGENIQNAIDDVAFPQIIQGVFPLGVPYCTVTLPSGINFSISSTIIIGPLIMLDLGGSTIKPTGNFNVAKLDDASQVRNGVIDVSGVDGYSSAAICFDKDINFQAHINLVEKLNLVSANQSGIGIYINVSSNEAQVISGVYFDNVRIDSFEYGIFFNHSSTKDPASGYNSYMNGNYFSNIRIINTTYCIKMFSISTQGGGTAGGGYETTGNFFDNIYCYCTNKTESIIWHDGWYITGMSYNNIYAIGWDNNSGTRIAYNFTARAYLYLSFSGGGNDVALPVWSQWDNPYMVINRDTSTLMLGKLLEYR